VALALLVLALGAFNQWLAVDVLRGALPGGAG
jgi:hypothetical protein